MKRNFFTLAIICGALTSVFAQKQLPNLGFETWSDVDFEGAKYSEPDGWSVGEICASAANTTSCAVSGTKTATAYQGSSGVAVSSSGMGFSIMNMPIADRPEGLAFYANFADFNNSASTFAATVFLHNGSILSDNAVIVQSIGDTTTVIRTSNPFEKFVLNFDKTNTAQYEYISVVFTLKDASKYVKSTVIIDNAVLIYNGKSELSDYTTVTDPIPPKPTSAESTKNSSVLNITPNPTDGQITFGTEASSFTIYSVDGTPVGTGSGKCADVTALSPGVYRIDAQLLNGTPASETFIKK